MKSVRLTHLFSHFSTLGGVESILRRHRVHDEAFGFDTRIIALFEPGQSCPQGVEGLGLTGRDSIASIRRKVARVLKKRGSGVVIYHNSWGLPFLAEMDQAQRRLVLLHSDLPTLERMLKASVGWVDGFLCVSENLLVKAASSASHLAAERFQVAPYPISPPHCLPERKSPRGRPFVLGFVGRLVREQKRIDRLLLILRNLDQAGFDYRFEVLGEGRDRAWLESQLRPHTRVVFHGRKEGGEYWGILSQWDAILFVSDYEGLPISLLEALSVGVVPIHPRIGSGGDSYAARVNPKLVYDPGDFGYVRGLLIELSSAPESEWQGLWQRCQELAAAHQGQAYESAFQEFVERILRLPRVSAADISRRPFYWSDHLPLGLLTRINYRALFKR